MNNEPVPPSQNSEAPQRGGPPAGQNNGEIMRAKLRALRAQRGQQRGGPVGAPGGEEMPWRRVCSSESLARSSWRPTRR
jgi:hypothetical protein